MTKPASLEVTTSQWTESGLKPFDSATEPVSESSHRPSFCDECGCDHGRCVCVAINAEVERAKASPVVQFAEALVAKLEAAPVDSFCDECGSEPCSCHLCSNCGEETCSDACRAERRYYDAADEAYDRACDEGKGLDS